MEDEYLMFLLKKKVEGKGKQDSELDAPNANKHHLLEQIQGGKKTSNVYKKFTITPAMFIQSGIHLLT